MSRNTPPNHSTNARVLQPGNRGVPLRAIRELAEELGVNSRSLTHWMRADPDGPRPAIQTTRHSASGHKTYYNPKEVRAWFAVNGHLTATKPLTQAAVASRES